jgi:hypothetical protein
MWLFDRSVTPVVIVLVYVVLGWRRFLGVKVAVLATAA